MAKSAHDLKDLVSSTALILASVDRRAHDRATLLDANSLLEHVVFPMSFPWCIGGQHLSRAIPYDIDDINGIRAAGLEALDFTTYGRTYELKQGKNSRYSQAAVRRSKDPGVLELTRYLGPTLVQRNINPIVKGTDFLDDDGINMKGELSYRSYEEMLSRKRQREEDQAPRTTTVLVSFRVGSTSSRSSIFEDTSTTKVPLFLVGMLPREVQEGKYMSSAKAREIANKLGTFDHRHGLGMQASGSRDRTSAGRTRKIWTEKISKMQSQRSTYRSTITGEKIENGTQKRPRGLRVALRVNGALISADKNVVDRYASSMAAALYADGSDHALVYSAKVVNDAILAACTSVTGRTKEYSQCRLRGEALCAQVLKDRSCEANSKRSLPFSDSAFTVKFIGDSLITVNPPQIDCIVEGDQLVVACNIPGGFESDETSGSRILNSLSRQFNTCSICWSSDDTAGSSLLNQCSSCGILSHPACCGEELADRGNWSCQPCKQKSDVMMEATATCRVCGLACGILELEDAGDDIAGVWVHSICKIWSDDESTLDATHSDGGAVVTSRVCHLCSDEVGPFTQCAASNCRIVFHPMCAVIASRTAQKWFEDSRAIKATTASKGKDNDDLSKNTSDGLNSVNEADSALMWKKPGSTENDVYLCTQYTLTAMSASFCHVPSSAVRSPGSFMSETCTLPVGFCGFHNPRRRADYYGLYPGGRYLQCTRMVSNNSNNGPKKGRGRRKAAAARPIIEEEFHAMRIPPRRKPGIL